MNNVLRNTIQKELLDAETYSKEIWRVLKKIVKKKKNAIAFGYELVTDDNFID
jgi:hypothetical protein